MVSVFLSYARSDDEPFARRLYEDLSERGFDVWFDRESMPGRGLTFLHEIREAINERDRLVLVFGPGALNSDYVEAEWRHALEMGKPVNPVLRLGDYPDIPDELKLLDAPDFRDDADYPERIETLVRQLSEPIPPMGKLVGVPSLPPHFLQRAERLRALKDAVMADLVRPQVVTGTQARTGVHGMGGIGKSVLAAALCRDTEVRRAFPDGVVWVEVRQEPNVVGLQREVARALGDEGLFDTRSEGRARLAELLADRAVLLVLDDVWETRHAEAFDALGGRCRMVMTTRDASLITALGGTEHQVHLLTETEARHLLAEWSEQPEDDLPEEALQLLEECGGLPLAIALAGALVREGDPWTDLLEALQEAELEFLDHPHGNMLRSIKVSVDRLTADEAERFAELRAFPADESVPEDAVVRLWAHGGGMRERHARRLLSTLANRALVQVDGVTPNRRVSLHDLVRDYTEHIEPDEQALHRRVVEAYRAACEDGWATGPDDGYFFTHLREHLAAAGESEELVGIATDLRWLEAKAEGGMVFDLAVDLTEAHRALPSVLPWARNIRLLDQALRSDLHFIARHPTTLFQCLWNRCWWYDCDEAADHYDPPEGGWGQQGPPWGREEPRLSTLLERWYDEKEGRQPSFVWVRSLRPPADPLGGAQIACLRGHEESVYSVAFDPSGMRVVSGSSDNSVRIWDAVSGAEIFCLRGHKQWVSSVAFDTSGERVVSGAADNTVRIWDAQKGQQITHLDAHREYVWSAVFDPSGGRVVSGSWDHTVRIWDANSGDHISCLRGHKDGVSSVAIDPSGGRMVSGSWDRTVRIWDAQSEEEITCLHGHEGVVNSVAFDRLGRHVVSGSSDKTVRIWDAESEEEITCLRGHEGVVNSVAFDRSGRRVVSGSSDNTVRIWDIESREEITCLRGHDDNVYSVAFAPSGGRVVSASFDKTVRIWDAEGGERAGYLRGHQQWVRDVAVASGCRRVVSGANDATVRIWNADSGEEIECLRGDMNRVRSVAFAPSVRPVVCGTQDRTVRIWDVGSGVVTACLRGHAGTVYSVAFDSSGRRVASGSLDNTVRIWDAESGTEINCLRGHNDWVNSVTFDVSGERVISMSGDRTTRVWDAENGDCLEVIEDISGVKPIVAGEARSRWWVVRRSGEIAVVDTLSYEETTWLPVELYHTTVSPVGRTFVGASREYLSITRLEGPAEVLRVRTLTATRLWLPGEYQWGPEPSAPGRWDDRLTAPCPWHWGRFEVDKEMLGADIGCPECGEAVRISEAVCDLSDRM